MQKINHDMMEFMVWIVEITAVEFFDGDKTRAYNSLKDSELWSIYVESYDATHTLGREYLLNEIAEWFAEKGVLTA